MKVVREAFGNHTPNGVPSADTCFTSADALLGSVRPALQARVLQMVGISVDVIRSVSGHHCNGSAARCGMDAS